MANGFDPADPTSADFRGAVGRAIAGFLDQQSEALQQIGEEVRPLHELARAFTSGGKRLRPAFCYWGYAAAAGQPEHPEPLLKAAASLDLLHVSALVHDDVMDASDTRRGVPAAHKQLESAHSESGWRGSAEAYGRAGAILLGDLLTMWSAQLLDESGIPPADLARALPIISAVRMEVTCGQFLDVTAQARPHTADVQRDLDEAGRVVEFKSARYTVQRPAQFGAALAGADSAILDALARFGSPLGRAFQFRDDLLGVFGDPAATGKPAGDDLREGKRTVLIAHAFAGTTPAGARRLEQLLGDPGLTDAEVAEAREIISESRAASRVEAMIEAGHDAALTALKQADLTPEGRLALVNLAELSVRRAS